MGAVPVHLQQLRMRLAHDPTVFVPLIEGYAAEADRAWAAGDRDDFILWLMEGLVLANQTRHYLPARLLAWGLNVLAVKAAEAEIYFLQEKLLEEAVSILQAEITRGGPVEEESVDYLARVLLNLAMCKCNDGRGADSISPFQRSAELFGRLIKAASDTEDLAKYRIIQIQVLQHLTDQLDLHRGPEAALTAAEPRTAIMRDLVRALPGHEELLELLRVALSHQAALLVRAGRQRDVVLIATEALNVESGLPPEYQKPPWRANMLHMLSVSYYATGDRASAVAAIADAVRLRQSLALTDASQRAELEQDLVVQRELAR
ncbi:hypothetical protein [Nonomuraea sp. NPDC002799]